MRLESLSLQSPELFRQEAEPKQHAWVCRRSDVKFDPQQWMLESRPEDWKRMRRGLGGSFLIQGLLAALLTTALVPPVLHQEEAQWQTNWETTPLYYSQAARPRTTITIPPRPSQAKMTPLQPQPPPVEEPRANPMPVLPPSYSPAAAPPATETIAKSVVKPTAQPHSPTPPTAPAAAVHVGGFGEPEGVQAPRQSSQPVVQIGGFANGGEGKPEAPANNLNVYSAGIGEAVVAASGDDGSLAGTSVRQGEFSDGSAASAPAMHGSVKMNHDFDTVAAPRAGPTENTPTGPADFEAAEILTTPVPEYTSAASSHHIEGEVILEVRLGADGSITVLQVLHGLGYGLEDSAAKAAQHLEFRPARRRGVAVDSTVQLHINFRLAY